MVKKPPSKKTQPPASSIKPPPASKAFSTTAPPATQDPKHQQRLLNIFSEAFSSVLSSEDFPNILQEIKQALFNRDFDTAFGREDYLDAYAARWSPTRTLCYASVLYGLKSYLSELALSEDELTPSGENEKPKGVNEDVRSGGNLDAGHGQILSPRKCINMLSIGGCAAEHVAFSSYLHQSTLSGRLTLLDSASWSHVASLLQTHLTTAPQLSKYASAAAKASNRALIETSQLSLNFTQTDVLQLGKEQLIELLGTKPLVVTIFFTLNELYKNGGIGKTTKFLANLGQALPGGSLLVVLDSPGSYSEATLGKGKKRYPMQWLLDHTLLETDTSGCKWEKLKSDDSIWFRLTESLSYPMQLENMRYQMHLYRVQRTS